MGLATTKTIYGHDLWCIDDLDPQMAEVDGRTCLVQALIRRIITPRGRLIDDPNYGTDVRRYLNADITVALAGRCGAEVDIEYAKDERVQQSKTKVSFVASVLTLDSSIVDLDGPFKLVLAIADVAAAPTILKVG